ncbi:MAG: SPFH domain-containing protein [Methylococcales bacterium]|nr:SPFH domain-containing protein [Methylococcales bacterium]
MDTFVLVLGFIAIIGIAIIKLSNKITPPLFVIPMLGVFAGIMIIRGVFNKVFFYAEPGYIYHVRTITGQEKVISDVGYNSYLFGRYNSWKRAMTVQASSFQQKNILGSKGAEGVNDLIEAEKDTGAASAVLSPLNIIFLDQVDANIEATVRFSMPTDREAFLKMAHEYRTPSNLLRTALIPAFKETLQATGSLMSAEEYYLGGRTEFNNEFETQITQGLLVVRREEKLVETKRKIKGSANAALGQNQKNYGNDSKMIYVVTRLLDKHGIPRRKKQKFGDYGVTVIDARITDLVPNSKFIERMQLKQKASADRAIAREQRIQEEEQRLLAIATGEREVAERQAKAKVVQIQRTTEAETEKQLAITHALKLKAESEIGRETAQINLEKARIDAETKQTLAEAEAYQKRVILEADDALAQKLDAEVKIQTIWAQAYAKRAVPTNVFGGGNGTPTGRDDEAKTFMKLLTLETAERLDLFF